MWLATRAVTDFEEWLGSLEMPPADIDDLRFSLGDKLCMWLDEEGYYLVAGRYAVFLQVVTLLLARYASGASYVLSVPVEGRDEPVRLWLPRDDDELFAFVNEDRFRLGAFRQTQRRCAQAAE